MSYWSKKSRRDVISVGQMKLLVSFMERHKDLALGRVRSKEGRVLSQRLWIEIANMLNADKAGCRKSAKGWNKFFNDYKCRLKSKIRRICQSLDQRGRPEDEPPCPPLTPLEERFSAVIGGLPAPQNPDTEPGEDPVHFIEDPVYFREEAEEAHLEQYEELPTPAERVNIKQEYNPPSPKQVKAEPDLEKTLINIENRNLNAKKLMIEVEKQKVLAIQSLANAVWAVADALQSPNKKTKQTRKTKRKSDNDGDDNFSEHPTST